MVDYVTIDSVEIGSVGMEWRASNGLFTLTMQNLADVATAANDDPHIVVPRLKLGHEGWPDNKGLDRNPFAVAPSAEPAVGRAQNFRLTNDGATLVCDFVDVPQWIAAAYPSRSPEWVGDVDPVFNIGVTTPGGKHYSMVITAIALLGVCWPALADIEDLPSLEHFMTTGTVLGGEPAATTTFEENRMPQPVATRADIDTVQRSFWADFATGDRLWWWPRDIYTDPNEVLADDDEGHLYRVPFTSNDDGEVQWAEPVRVRLDVVDLPPLSDPAATVALVAASHRAVLATSAETHRTFATAAEARPTDRQTQRAATQVEAAATQAASARPEPQEDKVPDITPDQLQRLRALPEDADQEQIDAALSGETTEAETPEAGAKVETTTVEEPELVATAAPSDDPNAARIELLERELADLRSKEQARETQAAQDAERRRVGLVATATQAGLIKPHEVDTWTSRVKDPKNGEGFADVLATMIRDKDPSLLKVPTTELGAGAIDEDAAVSATALGDGPLPDTVSILTPAERAQLAR